MFHATNYKILHRSSVSYSFKNKFSDASTTLRSPALKILLRQFSAVRRRAKQTWNVGTTVLELVGAVIRLMLMTKPSSNTHCVQKYVGDVLALVTTHVQESAMMVKSVALVNHRVR